MDINARIKWTPGMELTARTFDAFIDNGVKRRAMIFRTLSGNRVGVLPEVEFHAAGRFVQGRFEMDPLKCMGLLSSGNILCVDEEVSFEMPQLQQEGYYYFCVGLGDEYVPFEVDGIAYERPSYKFSVLKLEEIEQADMLPLARFNVTDGVCNIDTDYIAPHILLGGDKRLLEYRDEIVKGIDAIASHKNVRVASGRNTFMRLSYSIAHLDEVSLLDDMVSCTTDLVEMSGYFIYKRNGKPVPSFDKPSFYDIELWLKYLVSFLAEVARFMDEVTPEDDGVIDVDSLKAQIEADLTEKLVPVLSQTIGDSLKVSVYQELEARMSDVLKEYVDGTFKKTLHDSLGGELAQSLSTKLYDELYKALYDALYVPVKEESSDFMPLI